MVRRSKNTIHTLRLDSGIWCNDLHILKDGARKYFHNLFCLPFRQSNDSLHVRSQPQLSDDDKVALLASITLEEVKVTLMNMQSYKSHGPDSFQPYFFKKYWILSRMMCGSWFVMPFLKVRLNIRLWRPLVSLSLKLTIQSNLRILGQ